MDAKLILTNKNYKAKEKVEIFSNLLIEKKVSVEALINLADESKDPGKGTIIESIEFATQKQPEILNKKAFDFIVNQLQHKAPRIKWESAKVIANTAHLFKTNLDQAISHLLENTEHTGTVVRWSAATALCKIISLKKDKDLSEALKAISEREEKASIKKIYHAALKQK